MLEKLPENIKAQLSKRPKNALVVDEKGRVVIPRHIRKELGIEEGDTLIIRVSEGQIVLETRASAIKRVQDKYLELTPEISLSDELLAKRRLETEWESEELKKGRSKD